jgi:hypothetical protein
MKGEPEANVFFTSQDDAATGASSAVADGVTGADLYGISAEGIAALQYSINGQDYDADGIDLNVLGSHEEVYVYTEMHGGWLFRFPDDLVDALAQLSNGDMHRVAKDWFRVFQLDGKAPSLEKVSQMLENLVALARGANREGKPLFWRQDSC